MLNFTIIAPLFLIFTKNLRKIRTEAFPSTKRTVNYASKNIDLTKQYVRAKISELISFELHSDELSD